MLVCAVKVTKKQFDALFFFLFKWSFYVAQTGLELLGSSDHPASVSSLAGSIGISHHTQLQFNTFKLAKFFAIM
uniref:Uncharacterized protein n=1 Tax=Marmota marmota marmota TaxID=9994 RepID=A0A8C5YMQ2_MARMA